MRIVLLPILLGLLAACEPADPSAAELRDARNARDDRRDALMEAANLSPELEAARARVRRAAAELRVSEKMKEVMREEEGAVMRVYRDITGLPTVGVGHLVRPEDGLRVGDVIDENKVLDFLTEDLEIAERAVRDLVGDLELDQYEFDALVDLVFNVGPGNVSAEQSPRLNQAIRERDYDKIANELIYTLDRLGRQAPGLVYRSERRRQIFRDKSYDDPRER
ncbi:MAG: lysozyme [Pacificimonas sp.]|jgi:GH24 family phage-related lysozyme (muramidase)|nr:lysozyme [Pacificimonas sp.]